MKAETLEERRAIAREIQENAWNIVPHMYFGQWQQPTAHRKNVTGWIHVPEVDSVLERAEDLIRPLL